MRASVLVEQATSLVGRLALALMELTIAGAVIAGAIFVGHELREWRDWYWAAYFPQLEGPVPSAPEATEP